VGMVIAQSMALVLSDFIGWKYTYAAMGAFMVVGMAAAVLGPEPVVEHPPRTLRDAVVKPFMEFYRRGWPALLALVFLVSFRVGHGVAFKATTPFVLNLGFTNTELGLISKAPGMAGAIAGSLVGALLVTKLGLRRCLYLFGAGQALTTLLYVALGTLGKAPFFLAFTVGADNFMGGMASAAITVFLTGLCNRSFSATQYALLTSLEAVPMHVLGASWGYLADSLGWTQFFFVTSATMIPALALLALLPRHIGETTLPQGDTPPLALSPATPEAAAGDEMAAAAKKGSG
jgi:PAT family beta-lactamase induction signal transducer AmpG